MFAESLDTGSRMPTTAGATPASATENVNEWVSASALTAAPSQQFSTSNHGLSSVLRSNFLKSAASTPRLLVRGGAAFQSLSAPSRYAGYPSRTMAEEVQQMRFEIRDQVL